MGWGDEGRVCQVGVAMGAAAGGVGWEALEEALAEGAWSEGGQADG